MKELNILIMGETGVGKSTWINGIVNYLTYDSLEEARQNELKSVIATKFTILDDDYKEVTVRTGSDDNENATAGQSATQYPKSHTIALDEDTLVTLIDTPGIGDVRGIAQDKINFQRVLSHLSNIEELHGICILLKPNHARLTVVFQFCINELLTHLHRDAGKNIVFCFTNARSTFYKPGDSYLSLKNLLQKNKVVKITLSRDTMYCMDNESFRFLAAVKSGIKFGEGDRNNFSTSWKISVEETKRLLSHFTFLPSHRTRDTLSLNIARRLVTALAKLLADLSNKIQINITLTDKKRSEVITIDNDCYNLSLNLMVPTVDLVKQPLSYPQTVCGASRCTEIIKGIIHYKQICHGDCTSRGVNTGAKNQPNLMTCRVMYGSNNDCYCTLCHCPWYEHMHQTYKTTKVEKIVEDKMVKGFIKKKETNRKKLNFSIKTLEADKRVLEKEKEIMRNVSVEFASFLHQNAITPYNDATSDYLDHIIKNEKDNVKIDDLHSMKRSYDEEVKILRESIPSSRGIRVEITPERVDELVKKLCKLKKTGPAIKRVMKFAMVSKRSPAPDQETAFFSNWDVESLEQRSNPRWYWGNIRDRLANFCNHVAHIISAGCRRVIDFFGQYICNS